MTTEGENDILKLQWHIAQLEGEVEALKRRLADQENNSGGDSLSFGTPGASKSSAVTRESLQRDKELELKTELLNLTSSMAKVGGWEFSVADFSGTWTPEVARIHELDPDEPTNMELGVSFYLPESRRLIEESISKLISEAIPYDVELEMITAKGNHRWVRTIGIPIMDGEKVLKAQGIFQDITEQKNAREALITERSRLTALLESIPDPVWLKDVNGVYLLCNKRFEQLYNKPAHEIVGKTDYDFVDKELADFFREHDRDAAKAGKPKINIETLTFGSDGYTGLFQTVKTPINDLKGEAMGVLGIARDITELKKAETAAIDSQRTFKDLFENVPVSLWEEDFTQVVAFLEELKSTGVQNFKAHFHENPEDVMKCLSMVKVLKINRETLNIYETESDQELIENLGATFLPESLDLFTEELVAIAEGNNYFEAKTRVKTTKGNIRDVIIRLFTHSSVKGHMAYVTTIDITELTRAQSDLQALNEQLEDRINERTAELLDLYNNAPCGYHSLDATGKLIRVNDTELKWLGYSREEIEGKVNYLSLFTEESRQKFRELFPSFLKQGYINDQEFDVVGRDGSVKPILVNGTAVKDKEGNFIESRSTIVDITERRKSDLAIKAYQKELEIVNKDLEAFAYSISHDLRAPLRHIDGFAKLLKMKLKGLDDNSLHYFEKLEESTGRMGRMIDDLLVFSRLGQKSLTKIPVNLNVLVKKVVDQFTPELTGRKVMWDIKPLPEINGDVGLLQQVFENLIGNALKFSSLREVSRIEIASCPDNPLHCFYVRDNGAGFDMQYASKLFGVFQRLHTMEEFEGTGIGLANVKQIIQKHGGEIRAEGAIDEGATFYVTI